VYWETETRFGPVADVMSRNRFQQLLTVVNSVDNNAVSDDDKKADNVWKLRPWLEQFCKNCLDIIPEENNSVDEMMIAYKGRFSKIKQYMRGKPHPWGFKIWARTGTSGILCDFDVYQGSVDRCKAQPSEYGMSGEVVLKLVSTLPDNQNYKIYADNFFTSVPLVVKLAEKGIIMSVL